MKHPINIRAIPEIMVWGGVGQHFLFSPNMLKI
jgi:hypothetical protein